MVTQMKLDDLKTGMIVTLRNGLPFTVIRNMAKPWNDSNDILVRSASKAGKGWMPFDEYKIDMRSRGSDRSWDIVTVELPSHPFGFMDLDYGSNERTVIWKEIPAVKLTHAEIEARLGYKIEIVSDNEEED